MYLKEYFPFYTTYANPLLYEGERMQDKEFNLMKSYYPGTVQHIQEKIEEECNLMDYEGSRLYDEYPDKYMIYHLSCKIRESMEPEISTQAIRENFLDELIQVMLCQEISRRRCRRYRCSSYKQSYNPHNNTVDHWPGRPVLPASRKPPSMRKPVSETCMEHPDKYRPYISYSIPHQSPAYPDKSPEVSSQIPQNTPYVWLPFPSFPRHQKHPLIHQLSEQ